MRQTCPMTEPRATKPLSGMDLAGDTEHLETTARSVPTSRGMARSAFFSSPCGRRMKPVRRGRDGQDDRTTPRINRTGASPPRDLSRRQTSHCRGGRQAHTLRRYAGSRSGDRLQGNTGLCRSYMKGRSYSYRIPGEGVNFVAINPNNPKSIRLNELGYTDVNDSLAEMKIRTAFRHREMPYLYDGETQGVSIKFGVVATPHIYLFDQERKLQYQGRIDDNQREELVKSQDAAIDRGECQGVLSVTDTHAFGCTTSGFRRLRLSRNGRRSTRSHDGRYGRPGTLNNCGQTRRVRAAGTFGQQLQRLCHQFRLSRPLSYVPVRPSISYGRDNLRPRRRRSWTPEKEYASSPTTVWFGGFGRPASGLVPAGSRSPFTMVIAPTARSLPEEANLDILNWAVSSRTCGPIVLGAGPTQPRCRQKRNGRDPADTRCLFIQSWSSAGGA